MKTNVGSVDRALRIVLGLAILSAIVWVQGPARWLGLIGLVPLATAVFKLCPLYSILGISSSPATRK